MSTSRSVTQDPIEQVLDKLGSFGLPVAEIGSIASGVVGQVSSMDLFDVMDQVTAIDPTQLDVGEIVSELTDKFNALDPSLKVPVAIAAGFVGARVIRWIIQ